MSFALVTGRLPSDRAPWARLYLSRALVGGLFFGLSRPLVDQLNWQAGDRVLVSFGIGEDLGEIRLALVGNNRAGHKLTKYPNGRAYRVSLVVPGKIGGVPREEVIGGFDSAVTLIHRIGQAGELCLTVPRKVPSLSLVGGGAP